MAAETTKVLIKPLNGNNYATWKVQCKMALIKDGLWNIVTGAEGEPDAENGRAKYLLRKDRALATIVLSVEPKLLYLLGPDPEDPVAVWKKLADQFQKKTWANKLTLRRKLHNLKLKDGQSVQKHVKALTEIFDKLSIIGDPLDEENQVVHLLASLPESYDMLVTALEASPEVPKLDVVTERLLHEESKRREKEVAEDAEVKAMPSKHRKAGKGPKCHHCGKIGHIKRECWKLAESSGKDHDAHQRNFVKKPPKKQKACAAEQEETDEDEEIVGLVVEHALATSKMSNWIVDSGATCHMCHDEEAFDHISVLDVSQDITVGDGYSVRATGKGNVILDIHLPNGKIKKCRLADVLLVKDLSYNLLSISKAAATGKKFEFEQSVCKVVDDKHGVIATATKYGNLYYLNCVGSIKDNKKHQAAMKCASRSEETKEWIWHRRYGHLGARNLERIAKEQLVDGFDYDAAKTPSFCEPCVDGKQCRMSFPKTGGERSEELLGVVHSDICGKIETKSLSGAEYFVTFIDDKSRVVWAYPLKHKNEVFKKFIEWKALVEKSSGMKVKVLRTDNGGEYTSNEFEDYLTKHGIQHELTVPKTPQQNGVAERMNRTLVESIRSMLADSQLPKRFWAEALSTAAYLRNRCPTNAVKGKTPYEAWTGNKPNVGHLRIFGCDAYAHIPKDERRKLDSKTKRSIFLGYGNGVKGYRLYDKAQKRVFYSRDVTFNEEKSTEEDGMAKNTNDEPSFVEIEHGQDADIIDNEEEEPQRGQRERQAPNRYGEWVYIANGEDPVTAKMALSSPDAEKWKNAMESELDSLDKNDVWDLCELPQGREAVGSKWVFKRKYDVDGNVERYKARLVAQGYNQRHGIDYDETFSPVVRFESVRALIALAAKKKLHLHQLDVATAFLNGELKEEIYMKQPEGFAFKGKEHLVCKLKKSIYGLKQSPRCWNEALDNHLKKMGFKQSNYDPCIYMLNSGGEIVVIAVYVDDIIIAGKTEEIVQQYIKKIAEKFDVTDMGTLHHFLGMKITYADSGDIWIGQPTYVRDVLKKFGMDDSKPVATPVESGNKLVKATDDDELVDTELYQSAVGSLLYLSTKTRPDIAYAVGNVARFSSKPSKVHWISVKRIMRYLNGTLDYGLMYHCTGDIAGYSDADWAGDHDDRKSTSGFVFMMSGAVISWNSKKQTCVALSTAEAEYIALAKAAQESIWLQRLLGDMGECLITPMTIFEDNQSTIAMTKNPQFHGRAKHIDIKFHFIREQVTAKTVELKYCRSSDMIADMMTKGLCKGQFAKLRSMSGIVDISNCE